MQKLHLTETQFFFFYTTVHNCYYQFLKTKNISYLDTKVILLC